MPKCLPVSRAKAIAELSATADFIAGKFEFEHGNIGQSRQYFESALRFQPDNSTILIYYSAVLVRTGNAVQALPYAQRAAPFRPQFARRLHHAGLCPVRFGPHQRSHPSWKRSLELRPDAAVQNLLAKAQREQTVESDFSQGESIHFTLHYEGRQTSEAFPLPDHRRSRVRL